MRTIAYPNIYQGYNNGNIYIITESETDGQFNVYQLFDEYNDYATASDIRAAQLSLKNVPDEEIIVAIQGKERNAFLIMNQVDHHEMNSFKLTLDEIL
ncbi:hypothetical protein [Paenibacillus sp. 37]|uniref:hypothetical protein n=1 Tax=Paenibacillus sp. 37 TaxID=2607911 RepID=UPI00122E4575|nr:hypothetical protein [Paenibacillus sp. 37]